MNPDPGWLPKAFRGGLFPAMKGVLPPCPREAPVLGSE